MRLRRPWLGALALASLALSLQAAAERSVSLGASAPPRISIAAGPFSMGLADSALASAKRACVLGLPAGAECDEALFADERPAHEVELRSYAIDRTEVSHAAYLRCVVAGACAPSAAAEHDVRIGLPEQPVVQVTWQDAQRYCRFVGGSLPTEAQWERAARGGSERAFPWGDSFNTRLANHGTATDEPSEQHAVDGYRYAAPVHAYPDGKSFYGALNMAGNVWELVLDRYAPYDGAATRVEPTGPSTGDEHVIRGGSWRTPPLMLRTTFRAHLPVAERRPDVGFRCAYPGPTPRPVSPPPEHGPDAGL